MSKRFGDGVQKTLVQIGVLAAHDQFHVLAALSGHVAHHAREAAEELLHRDHANFHDRTLQIIQHASLKGHGIAEASAHGFFGSMTGKFSERLLKHGLANNQFPYQVEHAIDALGIHAQDVFHVRMNVFVATCMFFSSYPKTPTEEGISDRAGDFAFHGVRRGSLSV